MKDLTLCCSIAMLLYAACEKNFAFHMRPLTSANVLIGNFPFRH